MLSDALFEYQYVDDKILGATELARDIEHYALPPHDYPDDMIRVLREACESVLKNSDVVSIEQLNSLAETVRCFLDCGWSFSDWRSPPEEIFYSKHPFLKGYVKPC